LPIGGLAAAIFAVIHVPDNAKKEPFSLALVRKSIPQLDLIGFAMFVPPSIMFLLALQFGSGNAYAWDSATIIGLFVGAAVGIIIFIFWERYMGDRAMLPGSIIKRRIVWTSCIYGMCSEQLLAHILSSCERRRPNDEWSACPTEHIEPAGLRSFFGSIE
jgi:hypothetical protein